MYILLICQQLLGYALGSQLKVLAGTGMCTDGREGFRFSFVKALAGALTFPANV